MKDCIGLAFLITTLNDQYLLSHNIGNANSNICCHEKIFFKNEPESREQQDKVVIIERALYGFKFSGAAWRIMFLQFMEELLEVITNRVKNVKRNETYYHELMHIYVNDVLIASHDPENGIIAIMDEFELWTKSMEHQLDT